jgi:hypothetical protein
LRHGNIETGKEKKKKKFSMLLPSSNSHGYCTFKDRIRRQAAVRASDGQENDDSDNDGPSIASGLYKGSPLDCRRRRRGTR